MMNRKRKRGLLDTADDDYLTPGGGFGGGLLEAGMDDETRAAKKPGFWQGGDKFTGRDALAAALAVAGDAFGSQADIAPRAVGMLAGGRMDAIEQRQKAQAASDQRMGKINALLGVGMSPEQAIARVDAGYTPPEAPGVARETQWYMNATPQERAAFDAMRPVINNGPYGQEVIPRSTITAGLMGGGQSPLAGRDLVPLTPEEERAYRARKPGARR